jgi:hypothetical protein
MQPGLGIAGPKAPASPSVTSCKLWILLARTTLWPPSLEAGAAGQYLLKLCLGSLGVVYGDIGTSPLYAVRECFHGDHGVRVTQPEHLGGALAGVLVAHIVVSLKYLLYVMRADNRGEGASWR